MPDQLDSDHYFKLAEVSLKEEKITDAWNQLCKSLELARIEDNSRTKVSRILAKLHLIENFLGI